MGNSRKGAKSKTDPVKIATYAIAAITVFGAFLWFTEPAAKVTGAKRGAMKVNGVVAEAAGDEWAAKANSFFEGWTLDDVSAGLRNVRTTDQRFVGMAGAMPYCDKDDAGVESGAIPLTYDARVAHPTCVAPVEDSKNCSSSYSIAAAQSLGARFCVADPKYSGLRLSSQQAVSCDKKSKGCGGGSTDAVWDYIEERGLYPESCLPYAGTKVPCKTVGDCKEDQKLYALSHCRQSNSKRIKQEIYNHGPVVAPMLMPEDLLVYSSGIFSISEGSQYVRDKKGAALQVAVVIVGWGKDDEGNQYWLVQNSWGTTWGEEGFARLSDKNGPLRTDQVVVAAAATPEAKEAKEKADLKAKADEAANKIERAALKAKVAQQKAERAEAAEQKRQEDIANGIVEDEIFSDDLEEEIGATDEDGDDDLGEDEDF